MRCIAVVALAASTMLAAWHASSADPGETPGEPAHGPWIQARVDFSSTAEWERFAALGDIDLMNAWPGERALIVTDSRQLERLRSIGYRVTVEIEDMEAYYASRIGRDGFGDYHTNSETEAFLDSLHAAYPAITTARVSLGTTHHGRDVWAIKISDNAAAEEDEPEVLFDALHHAREPMGVEAVLYYMTWLCERYGTDPEATFLVDNREIWFVPIVNPDGYATNEATHPNGGGMWRKNRVNYGNPCWGVDVNRNYPLAWGGEGSSGDPCSDTYRGPGPRSEKESDALIRLMMDHEFVTHISFHSVAGMILIPWSYTLQHTPDDALLRSIAEEMARYNGYRIGQAGELLYLCSGTTNDYAYGQAYQTGGVLSFCIEVGGSGFWPAEVEIPGLRDQCLWPQIVATRIAGTYLALEDWTIEGGDGDGVPEPGETLSVAVTVENRGLLFPADDARVVLTTNDPYVTLLVARSDLGTIDPMSGATNLTSPLRFALGPAIPDGHGLALALSLDAEGFHAEEAIDWIVGTPYELFRDDMESGTGNWIENDGAWGLTAAEAHSPDQSYTDSPSGPYGSYTDTWIELAEPLDLSTQTAVRLAFWHLFSTGGTSDPCAVEASDDGGLSWRRLSPIWYGTNGEWLREEVPLTGYAGTSSFKLRFRLQSDGFFELDGWYVDDVSLLGRCPDNAVPTPPVPHSPEGAVAAAGLTLVVGNSTDADAGDALTYGFALYRDELTTDLVETVSGVPQGDGETSWAPAAPLDDGSTYWWRAWSDDGAERSLLSDRVSFTVDNSIPPEPVTTVRLLPATPNPFRDGTSLIVELPAPADATVRVYDAGGRVVRVLLDGPAVQGRTEVRWDGTDESGAAVGSGLYFARLDAAGRAVHRKLVLTR